ncbi:MAG TPA: hypothetical protein PK637_00390 [Flavobacteriales bacterium]|nr:hypothetical protein [Flavobacteriales bacterium]HRE74155.1 hypothetical protein [Flavobacteriales bacterium]HRE95188.1 hypothetical protein [Flavobacteriales bacterium]HRJ35979.1 hypothetical protein [Flavobacteriales bacterium]HRJ38634.1 hypothetical protein [Flavobacteriales bacterium]
MRFLLLLYTLILSSLCFSQASIKDSSILVTEIKMSGAAQVPVGQLAQRFSTNASIGLEVYVKTPSQLGFGLQGTFIFGNNVKETSILDGLRDSNGQIIDLNGEYARVLLQERGFTITGQFGYLIPVLSPNPNSGILIKFGAGFMSHKIRIGTEKNPVPQLTGEYLKGYDRLTYGLTLQQFVGYQYLNNRRMINFFFGFEIFEGFTKNRRAFNFDQVQADHSMRTDILTGIRAGWILPLYPRPAKAMYFN